jgi:hypothetical protein
MTFDDPSGFDFYVDTTRRHPVIGLVITSATGSVTVPFSVRTADDVGALLRAHARAVRTENA